MKKVQRTFYPGSEWIYFKVYTGIKTADILLIFSILPLYKKLMREKKISKCFFIRYTDPGFHIRLRMLVNDPSDIGYIMKTWHKLMKKYGEDGRINRIDISTYHRELERYGEKYIESAETLFSIDTQCILSLLSILYKKDENYRWMVALKMIDAFFDDLQFDLAQRFSCIERMSEAYKMEFGFNMYNAKQLNAIYRDKRGTIVSVLATAPENPDLTAAFDVLGKRSKQIRKLIGAGAEMPENNLSSYIHMMMNRLFRSKNRMHELLIYDFLSRYYKSEMAKQKKNDE